jgi:hypothetical protein
MTDEPAWNYDIGKPDEHRDAKRVADLERLAKATRSLNEHLALLSEADALREKWGHPRRPFASVDDMIGELRAIAHDAASTDLTDWMEVQELGERASTAGASLEGFARDLFTKDLHEMHEADEFDPDDDEP